MAGNPGCCQADKALILSAGGRGTKHLCPLPHFPSGQLSIDNTSGRQRELPALPRGPGCPPADSPVLFVELVLPFELPAAHHTVVPEHQAPGDLLMQLRGQVPEEVGHVPHGGQLEKGVETDLP